MTAPDLTGGGQPGGRIPIADPAQHQPDSQRFGFIFEPGEGFSFRGRPGWTLEAQVLGPGADNHRRHIIPMHLLLESLCRAANTIPLRRLHNRLLGFCTQQKWQVRDRGDTCHLLEVVAYHIGSNTRNLWPGPGPENTAIGFLRGGVLRVHQMLLADCAHVRADVAIRNAVERLWQLRPGLHTETRTTKLEHILCVMVQAEVPEAQPAIRSLGLRVVRGRTPVADLPPGDAIERLERVLLDAAANLELDLSGVSDVRGDREQNRQAIALFTNLYAYTNGEDGGGDVIWQYLEDFMALPADPAVEWEDVPARPSRRNSDGTINYGGQKRQYPDDDPQDGTYGEQAAKRRRKSDKK